MQIVLQIPKFQKIRDIWIHESNLKEYRLMLDTIETHLSHALKKKKKNRAMKIMVIFLTFFQTDI